MGIETMVILAAAATAMKGYSEYQGAKEQISYAEKQKEMNIESEAEKQNQINRAEIEKQAELSRQHRYESGQVIATMGMSGLDLNVGAPVDLLIEHEITQQIDADRLSANINDERFNVKNSMMQANHALDIQKFQAKQAKKAAVTNTAIALGGMAIGGALAGGFSGGLTGWEGAAIGGGLFNVASASMMNKKLDNSVPSPNEAGLVSLDESLKTPDSAGSGFNIKNYGAFA